jgi:hypothetical protein
MLQDVVVVFTAKSVDRILKEGGTSAWRLDRNHARQCAYVICTRNANADWVEGLEEHHSAFLVGKIRDVVPCPATPGNEKAAENRYLIQFSDYAQVDIPEVWKGDRNPLKYTTLEKLGIDPSTLKWKMLIRPRTKKESAGDAATSDNLDVKPLTIIEAKKGLSLTFSVPPETIEIIIRG